MEFRVPLPYTKGGPASGTSSGSSSNSTATSSAFDNSAPAATHHQHHHHHNHNGNNHHNHGTGNGSGSGSGGTATTGGATHSTILEFDGTTVLCRVCGDKASGFHYGVHSCEGCKGFFRRSIQQKIQYRPCTKNQSCSILRVNRNRCQYCRLKKCISVGMSRDAVRFGRVPKREKAKILAAMQQCHVVKNAERVLQVELDDLAALTRNIISAHLGTCEFTREKVEKLYERAEFVKNVVQLLACPLNPTQSTLATSDFSERFSPAIRGVVEFAKKLPGFSILSQDDQVTLLKAGVFEVLLVRLATMFRNNAMLCVNGLLIERDLVHNNARFLLDSMFKFAEQFNGLGLSDEVVGVFCSVVLMAPDRPGLRNIELITKLQSHFRSALSTLLPHPLTMDILSKIPDLRTLNTLHSEKLLAFKMEDHQSAFQQQQEQNNHNSGSPSSSPTRLYSSTCPYSKSFPSPSADSGIESSGTCSSPARSEDYSSSSGGVGVMEDMPVLKRALQAPPIIDNSNVDITATFVNHKKFRRATLSPQPQQQQPSNAGGSQQQPQSQIPTIPTTPPPTQLYPQLASALTRPTAASTSSSSTSILSATLTAPPVNQSSPITSILTKSLSEKPLQNSEQSDYIHSLIMMEQVPLNLCMKTSS